MRDAWEQMGPLLMLRRRGKGGEGGGGRGRGDGERGGDKEAGDVMRDALEVVRKKIEGKRV